MKVQDGVAEVNGTQLYYEVAGSGPPLALVHGLALDRRMWDDQFDAFARRYRVVRYDLRGFGQSALPTGEGYSHADDLKALLDHLGIAQAHVLGLSMGGGIAIDFALAYPDATRTLVLVDSIVGGFRTSEEWSDGYRAVEACAREKGAEAGKDLWLAGPIFWPAMEQPDLAARLRRIVGDYSGWHWLNKDPHRWPDPPAIERLGTITAPTLIVLGERDVADFRAIAATLQRDIPAGRTVVLPGVGHMSSMEAPQAFNDAVLAFLAQH